MEGWKRSFARSAATLSQSISRLASRRTGQRPLSSKTPKDQTVFRGSNKQRSTGFLGRRVPLRLAFTTTTLGLAGVLVTVNFSAVDEIRGIRKRPKEKCFRLSEIQQHNSEAKTYWVYRGDRVYDITDWVPLHPGGEVILSAAGKSIDAYWDLFAIHKNQNVYDILEQYYIGKIDPRDLINGRPPLTEVENPFSLEPARDSTLIQHTAQPCNAETPTSALASFITPNQLFYVRNHFWVPKMDHGSFSLSVELPDGTEVTYTLDDLLKKFKPHTVTATLQCSGNRRKHMSQEAGQTSGLPWDVGAISTAEWTGVRLRDVLSDAGLSVDNLPDDVRHAQFVAAEAYGASIPIEKAVDGRGDVLLAYQMNGEPLPRDHGYPLRAIVPGHVAARSVKWLKRIVLSDEESWSQWQRKDYKCFGPNEGRSPDWDSAVSIQETPVQAAITSLTRGGKGITTTKADDQTITIQGYAFSGGGRKIVRVDVSPDAGKTWQQATILDADETGAKSWCWRLWSHTFPAHQAGEKIFVKAVDEGYNTQPETMGPQYNFRGNLANAWHKVDTPKDLKPAEHSQE